MATLSNDFKVKNGLVVVSTATVQSTVTSVSSTTGALVVSGGIGLRGSIYAGGTAVIGGVDILNYDAKVWYVSASAGNDTFDGHRIASAFKTVTKALSVAQSGDSVFIQPGTYVEIFPMTVPQGVALRGSGLRAVSVTPTAGTKYNDAFYLNGESTISDFTVGGFFKPGSAFKFAPGAKITTRSPYVERFSVITRGSITSATDPYGFDAGDAGNGAYLDASVLDPTSLEPAMLWNEATFIVPNATGFYMTNGARAELLNGFVYFADKAIQAEAGLLGYGSTGTVKLRLSGITGTFAKGDTISYKSTTGTTVATGVISSSTGGYVYINGPQWGFETVFDRTAKLPYAVGNAKLSTAQSKFGGSSLLTDAPGDYVEELSDNDFQFGTGDYTAEGWIRTTTTATQQYFYRKGQTTATNFTSYLNAGRLVATHGTAITTGTTILNTGTWYHARIVHIGASNTLNVYINGTLDASTSAASANINNTDPFNISDNVNPWKGNIDDFRLSNVARCIGNFTAPTVALTSDATTVLMLHFDGVNNSTSIVDDPIATQNISSTGASPATATRIILADYHQFGAELRCIGSAACFGNQGIIANGTGTDLKLIAFNLSFVGSGKDLSDDSSLVTQANEIIKTNGGVIHYQTVDQNGDFRVGDSFLVNQRTGNVSFGAGNLNLNNISSIYVTNGTDVTSITPGNIEVGNLVLSGNTLGSLTGNLTLDPAGQLTIVNSDLQVNGSVTISQNLTVNGSAAITQATLGNYGVSTITAGTDTAVSTATGPVVVWNTSTLQTVTGRGATTNNAVTISNPTQATSTATGALQVSGGVGIGGNLYVGGSAVLQNLTATNFTASNSTIVGNETVTGLLTVNNLNVTGSASIPGGVTATSFTTTVLTVVGQTVLAQLTAQLSTLTQLTVTNGATVGGQFTVTGQTFLNGGAVVTTLTATNLVVTGGSFLQGTTATTFNATSETISGTSTIQTQLLVTSTANSFSSSTGAVVVTGGVGIGKNLNVGGNTVLGTISYNTSTGNGSNITLNATLQTFTATSVNNTNSNVILAVPANNWNIVSTDGNYIRNVLSKDSSNNFSIGVAGSSFWNDVNVYSGPAGNINFYSGSLSYRSWFDNGGQLHITTTTNATSTATGALQVTGGVGVGGSVYAGQLVVIDPSNIPNSTSDLTVVNGSTSMNFISYVSAGAFNPTTAVGDSLIYFRGATQGSACALNIAPWSSTATGIRITNLGIVTIAATVAASSTLTGALVVGGGAGVQGNLYVGGSATLASGSINYIQITGNASGSVPTIASAGGDAGVGLSITTKNQGPIYIGQPSTAVTQQIQFNPGGGAGLYVTGNNANINYSSFRGAAAGFNPSWIARGGDNAVGLDFATFNTATINFYAGGDYNAGLD